MEARANRLHGGKGFSGVAENRILIGDYFHFSQIQRTVAFKNIVTRSLISVPTFCLTFISSSSKHFYLGGGVGCFDSPPIFSLESSLNAPGGSGKRLQTRAASAVRCPPEPGRSSSGCARLVCAGQASFHRTNKG